MDRDHRHLHADLHPAAGNFNVDPLFFGLLVAMNLQTAFLSPPVAMSAFYLKGVAPDIFRM
jgi:TRAP-type mannitol/chloroaromatic compound transport system permease large subunit